MKITPKVNKMQSGGSIPPFTYYTPLVGEEPTQQKQAAAPATTEESSSITEKDLLKMVGDIDGLPSDTDQIVRNLSWIFQKDNLFNKGSINSNQLSSRYLTALRQIKNANFSKKEYDSALDTVKANGGLNEVAITTTGRIVVKDEEGNLQQLTADEYLNNSQDYYALKNSDLLYLRAHDNNLAGRNEILSTVKNGIGISTINKIINNAIGKLGTVSISREGYGHTQESTILNGIEYLKEISNEGADLSGMSLDGIYKAGFLNKNQFQAAQQAIQYIYDTLDPNAITLLEIKSGNAQNPRKGAFDLIAQLITSQTDVTLNTTLNYEEKLTENYLGGEDSSGPLASLTQLDNVVNGRSTVHRDYVLNPGSNYSFVAPGSPFWNTPQEVSSGEGIQTTTLDDLLNRAGYDSVILNNSIYFGQDKVDPRFINRIIYDQSEGLAEVWLPYYQTDGGLAPNFQALELIESVEEELSRKGNVTELERKQAYRDAGIGQFANITTDPTSAYENGILHPFLVVTGVASDTGEEGIVTSDNKAVEKLGKDDKKDWKKRGMAIMNNPKRNNGKKGDYSYDAWWENNWFWLFDNTNDIYKGTIFMPLSGDRISAATRTGNINLPKSTFNADRLLKRGQISNNRTPLNKTTFN